MEEGTSWQFYTEAHDAWHAMAEACTNATTSIEIEQFIFTNDDVGKRFLDICSARADVGVRVRILCDAAGSFAFLRSSFWTNIQKKNLEIVFFNTFIPWTVSNHTLWYFRDHKKLLIVDGKIAFTGSVCLSNEIETWRDTHVRIEGEVVEEMQYAFESMWARARKEQFRATPPRGIGAQGFNYLQNIPRPRKRFLYYRLIDAIRSAQKYIFLTTPYFVPDRRFLRVLRLAARRGVDVRLIITKSSDHPIVDLCAQSYFHRLLKSGIKIYRYTSTIIHSKTAIIDDSWASVGSLNLDNISFLYNFEANIVSNNRRFVAELKDQFYADARESDLLTLEVWNARPSYRKILEFCVRPLRQFL